MAHEEVGVGLGEALFGFAAAAAQAAGELSASAGGAFLEAFVDVLDGGTFDGCVNLVGRNINMKMLKHARQLAGGVLQHLFIVYEEHIGMIFVGQPAFDVMMPGAIAKLFREGLLQELRPVVFHTVERGAVMEEGGHGILPVADEVGDAALEVEGKIPIVGLEESGGHGFHAGEDLFEGGDGDVGHAILHGVAGVLLVGVDGVEQQVAHPRVTRARPGHDEAIGGADLQARLLEPEGAELANGMEDTSTHDGGCSECGLGRRTASIRRAATGVG